MLVWFYVLISVCFLSIVYVYPSRVGLGYPRFFVLSFYAFMPLCVDIRVLYCLLSISIPVGWGRVINVLLVLSLYAFMLLCIDICVLYCLLRMSIPVGWGRAINVFSF